MSEYLLFIDTEGSGLPKKWTEPYSKLNNWPFAVQVSWLVFTQDGNEVKREDHYIGNGDFNITRQSIKIHGITQDFLNRNGKDRKYVMQLLKQDLLQYKPIVIGHFMELDYHVLAADFYRSEIDNPIENLNLPAFCTMLASKKFVRNPQSNYLKLGQLYDILFNTTLKNPHNAIVDAKATADCFFELLRRGDLTPEMVANQHLDLRIHPKSNTKTSWIFLSLILISILIIIFWI